MVSIISLAILTILTLICGAPSNDMLYVFIILMYMHERVYLLSLWTIEHPEDFFMCPYFWLTFSYPQTHIFTKL